jgi:hypothetical protein
MLIYQYHCVDCVRGEASYKSACARLLPKAPDLSDLNGSSRNAVSLSVTKVRDFLRNMYCTKPRLQDKNRKILISV